MQNVISMNAEEMSVVGDTSEAEATLGIIMFVAGPEVLVVISVFFVLSK